MADEFTAGMCAENWWMHPSQVNFGSSPVCSSNIINNMDIPLWPNDHLDKKTRASDHETAPSVNSDEGSIIFYDSYKTNSNQDYADGSLLSMNNTLDIVDSNLSSSITQDWNHTILGDSKTSECNHQGNFLGSCINSSSDYRQNASADNLSEINKDWSAMKFSTINKDSFIDVYKAPTNQGSSYGYTSSLIKNLFDFESDQDSIFGNQYSMEYPTVSDICQEKFNDQFPSSSLLKSSVPLLPNQPLITNLNLPNNSSCNASNDDDGLFTSVQSQFLSPKFDFKLNCANLSVKSNSERSREMSIEVKSNSITEPAFKRQRIETPSSLPTFKVRKEKLGDRVTGLQQLVSPFGKTDTASVLHEAIEYIKLLHDQVTVLIAPYYKGGSPIDQHDDQLSVIDVKGTHQSLKNWGLCIVPISSTFQLTTSDFWTPTFGGSFK